MLGVLKSMLVRSALQIFTSQLQMSKILFSPSILVIWWTKPLSSARLRICQRLLGGDVVRAPRFDGVVGHVTNLDAPVIGVVGAALPKRRARVAARADARSDVSLVLLEPVGDALELDGHRSGS